ncbi:MAG: hypothetical protein RIR26_2903 [Pseudomonadota bacterium]|jgi:GMP synthase (glutamine-hydrolysing)
MILIVDFGSQYTEVLHRAVRDLGVPARVILPHEKDVQEALSEPNLKGVVLSGGPHSVYEPSAPSLNPDFFSGRFPILGICYGMQLMAHLLGGHVNKGKSAEYGAARMVLENVQQELLDPEHLKDQVWMSHGDHVERLPVGFECLAKSEDGLTAVMADQQRRFIGLQFHPEVEHTLHGKRLIGRFIFEICGVTKVKSDETYKPRATSLLREQLAKVDRNADVICALSGGVDSTVAASLVAQEIGSRLHCIFVDTGLLRKNEFQSTLTLYKEHLQLNVHPVNASELFLGRLKGVTDPEQKRKIIGKTFIDVFESESKKFENCRALVQGTIASDVIESSHSSSNSQVIKSHHNVGGLPEKMNMSLIEPLRHLFKDEVRALGRELGIPSTFIGRHPFPGPGLALRVLGEVNQERLNLLREVDAVLIDELHREGLYHSVWQAFAVLLPVRSVGVKGDGRSYDSVVALRCVGSKDGMTADWSKLPLEFLGKVSRRITNEVAGISRVVYDITSKPPATIEWE